MRVAIRIVLLALLAVALSSPASALPMDREPAKLRPAGEEPAEPPTGASCTVTSLDAPGAGVQPFVDPAAAGARVGTDAGSVTFAVYPYSCSYVVLQLANVNRPVPREPLPAGTPADEHRAEIEGALAEIHETLVA